MTVHMQKEYKDSNFLSFPEENTKVTLPFSAYSKYTHISYTDTFLPRATTYKEDGQSFAWGSVISSFTFVFSYFRLLVPP